MSALATLLVKRMRVTDYFKQPWVTSQEAPSSAKLLAPIVAHILGDGKVIARLFESNYYFGF